MPNKPCIDCLSEGKRGYAEYRGRCRDHARVRERDTHNPANRKVYNSKKWKQTRRKLMDICVDCGKRVGEHLDHITPLEEGGAPYDPANLQPLCEICHSKKTRREQQLWKSSTS